MANDKDRIAVIVSALKTVPEKRLLIIELANRVPVKYGRFDTPAVQEAALDIKLAIDEAKVYGTHTMNAVVSLLPLLASPEKGE